MDDFYTHSGMADRHLNKCKECARKDVADRLKIKSLDVVWLRKERERHRSKQSRYRSLGLAQKPSRAVRARWRRNNPVKATAQRLASQAVRGGKLPRKNECEQCGATGRLEKHHPNYSQPLNVVWLCCACHGVTRRKEQPHD